MTDYTHPTLKLWVCEVEGCGREYELPRDAKPHRWRGRIVCPKHAGDPTAAAFVADPEIAQAPVADVLTSL